MRGYVTVPQWYSSIKTLEELVDQDRHTGDAAAIDHLLGFSIPLIQMDDPGMPSIGYVVLRVEDDGSLTRVHANFDTSD